MKGSNDLKYKETGNDFVPMIPEDWEILKAKHIGIFQGSTVDKKIVKGEKPVRMVNFTDVYGNESMTITDEIDFMKVTAKDNQYRDFNVKIGDMLFTPSSEIREDIGQSALVKYESNDLVFSYHLIRLSFTREIDLEFKKYLFNNKATLQYFTKHCKGSTRKILGRTEFKNTPVFLPPFQTQQQIAGFLDYKCEQINRFINNKIEFIRILKEQRQSVINKAVTEGVSQNKGEWMSKKLKYIADVKFSNVDKHTHKGELKVRLCNYVDVYKNDFITNDLNFMIATATFEEIEKFKVKKGDVIITKDSETASDIAIPTYVVEDLDNVICAYHLAMIRANIDEIDSEFLFRKFQSKELNYFLEIEATGVTRVGLSIGDITGLMITYPKSIEEQKEIVKYIKEETKNIDELITKAEKEIILIKEYKESLISHAVTGQLQNIYYKK